MREQLRLRLVGERRRKRTSGIVWRAVEEGRCAWEQKVIEPEVPHRGEGLPKGDECACGSDYGASNDIPVVMDCPNMRQFSQRLKNSRENE